MQVISGTSNVTSQAISQFLQLGNTLSVFLIFRSTYLADTLPAIQQASSVAKDEHITALPFCPIANGNVINLNVQIQSFSNPLGIEMGSARLATLAWLEGADMGIIIGKLDAMQAMSKEQGGANTPHPYHMIGMLGDSTYSLNK